MTLNFGGEPPSHSLDYPSLLSKLRREFVDQSGDAMSGNLSVPRATQGKHAISKSHVESLLTLQKNRLEDKVKSEITNVESAITLTTANILTTLENTRVALLSSIGSVQSLLDREKQLITTTLNQLQRDNTLLQNKCNELQSKINTMEVQVNGLSTSNSLYNTLLTSLETRLTTRITNLAYRSPFNTIIHFRTIGSQITIVAKKIDVTLTFRHQEFGGVTNVELIFPSIHVMHSTAAVSSIVIREKSFNSNGELLLSVRIHTIDNSSVRDFTIEGVVGIVDAYTFSPLTSIRISN
jgi:hypothetical protein